MANNPPKFSAVVVLCMSSKILLLILSSHSFAAVSADISETIVETWDQRLNYIKHEKGYNKHSAAVPQQIVDVFHGFCSSFLEKSRRERLSATA
jgi:hypothetical protein